MKRVRGKRITAEPSGQQAEMSCELKALRIATAIEQLELIIERTIRRHYGIPG